MIKKIISAILTTVLVLTMVLGVSAESTGNEKLSRDQKIQILSQRGCPLSSIENAQDYLIDELLKDEGEFVKVTVQSYDINKEKKKLEVVSKKEISGDEVSIQSVMPTNDFQVTTYVERIHEKSGDNFKFTAYGNWNTPPYWCFTDLAALAWSDNFTLYYDSCTSYGITGLWEDWSPVCPRCNVSVEAGVSHEIPLAKAMIGQSYTQVAKVYKKDGTGTANVVADYAHKMVGFGGISAGFTVGGSGIEIGFSADITVTYDKAMPYYSSFSY